MDNSTKASSESSREPKVRFTPNTSNTSELASHLGLLGKLAQTPCLFEPHHDPITATEIYDCLSKLLEVRKEVEQEANRQKQRFSEVAWPRLWILTPTISQAILNSFEARLKSDWEQGIYFLAEGFRTAIIVIHQLPDNPETLWLRLLGRGKVRRKAIDELDALDKDHPFKSKALQSFYNLQKNLEVAPDQVEEDRQLIAKLAPLYQQDRQQAVQEGIKQGESNLVLRQLNRRLDSISGNLEERVRQLSVEQLEALGLALLDFERETDLIKWLESI